MSAHNPTQGRRPAPHGLFHTSGALLVQAPWQWLRNDSRPWAFWAGLAAIPMVLALLAAAALVWAPRPAAWLMVAMLAGLGLLALWGTQFDALLRLDHPHTARFVPGHMRTLHGAALWQWLALTAVSGGVALVASLLLGAGWRPALVATVASAAALVLVAAAMRWPLVWLFMWLPFPVLNLPGVEPVARPLITFFRDRWNELPWVCAGLALLALAALLLSLFGKADATHARAYARRTRLRKVLAQSAAGQKPTLAAFGRWGEWLGWPLQRLAEAWLVHVLAKANPQRASVMARADVVLHGAQHWTRHLSIAVFAQIVMFASFVIAAHVVGGDISRILGSSQVGVSIGLASMVVSTVVSLPGALWATRREQALLMLLPGMPQGAALNQALARRQMQHFLCLWAATLPGFLVLAWVGNSVAGLAFLGMALPLGAWMWRDASRLRMPSPAWNLPPFVALVVLGLLSLLLLRWQAAALLPWSAAVLLLTAGLLRWRWRRLGRLPQALPAGRWS